MNRSSVLDNLPRVFTRSIPPLVFLLAALPAINAQEASSLATMPDDEVYEMPVFQVDTAQDDRYLAANAVSGTRINTPIKELPMSLEVITSEFMEDIGADDFRESLRYSSGILNETSLLSTGAEGSNNDRSPSSRVSPGNRNNAIIIRGFSAPFQQRMGFRIGSYIGIKGNASDGRGGIVLGSLIDSVSVDRNEVVRGPGALLYGLGVLSGIVNVLPKRPLPAFHTNLKVSYGSHNYKRAALDTTGPILKNGSEAYLSYRLMGAWQDEDNWADHQSQKRQYLAGQLQWHPFKSATLFLEYQYGRQELYGTGASEIRYNAALPGVTNAWQHSLYSSEGFRNPYNETYVWGEEDFFGPDPAIWDPNQWDDIWNTTRLPGLPAGFQIPDEALTLQPLEGPFNDERTSRVTGSDPYYIRDEWSFIGNFECKILEGLTVNLGAYINHQDTEELLLRSGIYVNGMGDGISFQPGLYKDAQGNVFDRIPDGYLFGLLNPGVADQSLVIQRLGMGYWWTKQPQMATTVQVRAEANYQFETPFLFGTRATHSFLLGRHDLKDQADVAVGAESVQSVAATSVYPQYVKEGLDVNEDVIYGDPVFLRSFFDWTQPFVYQGEPLARPAEDYYTIDVFYTGHYGVYHGKWFDDKLGIIAGVRTDRYQAKEDRWLREAYNPDNVRLGSVDSYYVYDEAVKVETFSFGATYEVTKAFNVYAVIAEGVVPVTSQFDGNGDAIDPELSKSIEFGVKFDLLDRRISGAIAAFRIDRENAIWKFGAAPNPGEWKGGRNPQPPPANSLDPAFLANGEPLTYGVSYNLYFRDLVEKKAHRNASVQALIDSGKISGDQKHWLDKLGLFERKVGPVSLGIQKQAKYNELPRWDDYDLLSGQLPPIPSQGVSYVFGQIGSESVTTAGNEPYVYVIYGYPANNVDYALAQDPELQAIMEVAYNEAFNGTHPETIAPIASNHGTNASSAAGRPNVTFEEEAIGFDGQIVLTPIKDLQIILSYAHVEREASSAFRLASTVPQGYESLGNIGTEYDVWVRAFGRDAFADPKDPTTIKDEALAGTSLYYGSEDTFSLWGRYNFSEDWIPGLGVGLGFRYIGEAQTHVAIGSDAGLSNRYPTPPLPAYTVTDAALYYKRKFKYFDFDLSLNVYNLFDKTELATYATYQNFDYPELAENRRSIRYLDPRYFRLTLTISI